jgi:AraC family transcriptional regulator
MKIHATQQFEAGSSLLLSSQTRGWESIFVEQFWHPSLEGNSHHSNEHAIYLALGTQPLYLFKVRDGKTYSGPYFKDDISIAPARMPSFVRWDGENQYLKIRVTHQFMRQVAGEALEMNDDRLELIPEARIRDPQIEAIGKMLLTELQREQAASRLYVESLANILAVHLIRQYTTVQPVLPSYEGGLPQRQLMQVLDYVDAHLHQDIKLADLAALLSISQFHFSHQFKQATGISPYQYLLQQRIERAKQLLKRSDLSIANIAVLCGFNSHSHLSKQFRQLTGMTPKAYRVN